MKFELVVRAVVAQALQARAIRGRIEDDRGFAPLVLDPARRTSFQSPPSMRGRSRANGIRNFWASDRCRSAKRSPAPFASVALQKRAPGSIAIRPSGASSAAIVPGPMPPPVALERVFA